MDLRLTDQVAIVTGASRGLGEAAVRSLVAEGATVVAVGRDQPRLQALAAELPGVVPLVADLTELDRLAEIPALALKRFGRLDILVNNAGIAPARAFADEDAGHWRHVFDVNVTAPALLAQAAGRHLMKQGHGKVINVASTAGLRGKPTLVAYSASKGALIQLTRALAAEWAQTGVQVNAIAPGAFQTDAQQVVLDSPDLLHRRTRRIPAKRMAEPGEFSPLVCYLASSRSDFVTGSVFVIDGGEEGRL